VDKEELLVKFWMSSANLDPDLGIFNGFLKLRDQAQFGSYLYSKWSGLHENFIVYSLRSRLAPLDSAYDEYHVI